MLNLYTTNIETLSVHRVGNQSKGEPLFLSESPYALNDEIIGLLKELFEFCKDYEGEVPGASARDCGNFRDMNLPMAKYLAKKYLDEVLENMDNTRLIYPE